LAAKELSMSALPDPVPKLTPEEYLEAERLAEHKSEYLNGEVYDFAGTSEAHADISANCLASIHTQFRGRDCKVYSSDLRVKVNASGPYVYPDVVAVCGERLFEDDQLDTLLNPTVVIEVLSDSTEAHDRGWKWQHYQKLPSLREYVLIAQDQVRVEHYIRQEGGMWLLWTGEEIGDSLRLGSIGCEVPFADLYDKVEFPQPDMPAEEQEEGGAAEGAE